VNIVHMARETGGMVRTGYHHGSLHEALVAAAFEAARVAGPDAVQVRPLAKELGVSPSAVYRHVPDRDHLLAEVSRLARQELAARQIAARDAVVVPQRAPTQVRARLRLRAVGQAYVDFAVSEPRLFDTAFTPCLVRPATPDDPSAWQVLLDGVAELAAAGVVDPERVHDAPFIAWAGVHGIASIVVRDALDASVTVEHAVDIVLQGIMRALTA
jgi:AcrR family transcriptional regulator